MPRYSFSKRELALLHLATCHSERSRLPRRSFMRRLGGISISRYQLIRDVSAPLDMTTKVKTAIVTVFLAYGALAQESQTPTSPAMPEDSPSLSSVPRESVTPSPESAQTPPTSPARRTRIRFVPTPI